GLNNGLQALIARRAGENRPEEIGRLFNQGIFISLGIATIGIILTFLIAPLILRYAIHSDITYRQAISFLRIRIWGLPFLYVYQMRNALLVGTNQSRLLVLGTMAEALSNVFFDYTLIFGKLGFPQWGFNGAAVSSIIAEFTGMFVIFLVIHKKGIGSRFALFKHFTWDVPNNKLILSMSAPLVFQHAISIISWTFFYLLIEHHGERDLAISNTMRNIFGFFGIFTWSFAATSNAMVSNIIGQGKQDRVVLLIGKIVKISLLFSIIICILLNLVPELFLSIYGQGNDFIIHAIPVVRVVSAAMILMSFGTVWLNAVTGTGNSKITFLIEATTIILYCLYIYLVLEKFKLNITIGWMSEWLYWIGMFSLSYWYIRSGKWKSTKI
ncbi:MAG: MATE family efflux transporter, partial [Bacteroidetes bacterium]|nr:MATE family efflux transporter [Bacteroidota bacterium]